jgi:hypothetical protein
MSQVTNKVVVTLNEGVDVDGFILEMSEEGNISQYVPSRPVEIFNLKEDSLYNVDFVMTYTEMEELKKDPRVLDCRWGTKADNGLFVTTSAIDTHLDISLDHMDMTLEIKIVTGVYMIVCLTRINLILIRSTRLDYLLCWMVLVSMWLFSTVEFK